MSHSDPVADFLTRVRNGLKAKHRYVDIRCNKLVHCIAEVLREESFVEQVLLRTEGNAQEMRVFLKYGVKRKPVLTVLNRVSSPGCRRYVRSDKIPYVKNGLGMAIVSTSQGVMSGQKARQLGLGGELLCCVS
jgi:small subunit ribosomal protein S8